MILLTIGRLNSEFSTAYKIKEVRTRKRPSAELPTRV